MAQEEYDRSSEKQDVEDTGEDTAYVDDDEYEDSETYGMDYEEEDEEEVDEEEEPMTEIREEGNQDPGRLESRESNDDEQ